MIFIIVLKSIILFKLHSILTPDDIFIHPGYDTVALIRQSNLTLTFITWLVKKQFSDLVFRLESRSIRPTKTTQKLYELTFHRWRLEWPLFGVTQAFYGQEKRGLS